jgi:hypothetical protein
MWTEFVRLAANYPGFISAANQTSQDSNYARFSNIVSDTLLHTPAQRVRISSNPTCGTTVYLIKLRIVRIKVVVTLVVEVEVCSLGGGGGSTAPGECTIPANAETANVRLKATTALVRRNPFIVVPPK